MGDSLVPVDLGSGRTAKQVALGRLHTCAILDNGSVKCWGYNAYGQLGLGHGNNIGDGGSEMGNNLPTVNLGTGRTAKQIAVGNEHACAILDNDLVKCWGQNRYGVLGHGNTLVRGDEPDEMGDNLPVTDFGTGRKVKQIASGSLHNCAILDNNSVKCWGYNYFGQLGQGSNADLGGNSSEMGNNLAAVNLGNGRTASQIELGLQHSCVILDNELVKCWGHNLSGQLGLGNAVSRGTSSAQMGDSLPTVNLGSGRTVKQIVMGHLHSCAILDNDSVKCWGSNASGRLGQVATNNLGDVGTEMGDSLRAVDLGSGNVATQLARLKSVADFGGLWPIQDCLGPGGTMITLLPMDVPVPLLSNRSKRLFTGISPPIGAAYGTTAHARR